MACSPARARAFPRLRGRPGETAPTALEAAERPDSARDRRASTTVVVEADGSEASIAAAGAAALAYAALMVAGYYTPTKQIRCRPSPRSSR
ncbi:MAG: hypothetical protein R3E53_08790 [Myxococcota bacterium]